jgi:hypothetical protein
MRVPSVIRSALFGLLGFSAILLVHSCSDGSPLAPELPPTDSGLTALSLESDPAAASTMGAWSAPFPWPNVAVHLSLLPNGTVMSFGRTAAGVPYLWDPGSGSFTAIPSPSLLFCAGHTLLPNGRLFVAGGHILDGLGLPNTNVFDAGSNAWLARAPMARGRWYPTTVTMGNGEVVVLAGTDESGATVLIPEVWKATGGWRTLTGASKWLPYYPRAFLAPNGRMFYAGELQQTSYLNPAGSGSWQFVANRVIPDREYGAAVMYRPGRILYLGGGNPPTSSAEIIDLNNAAPAWRLTNPMANARRQTNATLLPNGDVLVTGGTSAPGFNNEAGGVHAAEVWSPATEGWTTLASNSVTRVYHGTTLLLPDGRILHTGSGDGGQGTDQYNAEIYSPPYLFQGPRPAITTSPSVVSYGATFPVGTPAPAAIARVTWVRLMSTTHAFDMNQRFVQLNFTAGATALTVKAPASRNRVPPGHYMMFVIDGTGVPSIARIVQIK